MTLSDFLLARFAEQESAWSELTNLVTKPDYAKLARWIVTDFDAKRRILDLHRTGEAWCDHCSGWYGPDPAADCPTLRLLALPYASHPDYRDEWRPA